MPIFLAVRLLGSDSGLRDLRSACSIAAAGSYGSTSGFVETISSKCVPTIDQVRHFEWSSPKQSLTL